MVCSTEGCGGDRIFARGLCQKCYNRKRRRGTVLRAYVVNTGRCSVAGCDKPSFAKNLCAHHYEKAQHPLNHTWRIVRSRYPTEVPASWGRFAMFLADVGDRPGPKHQFRRIQASQPYSASNVKWVAPVGAKSQHFTSEQQAAYGREWNLKNKFGIDGERKAAILAAQGGVCAICKKPEAGRDRGGKLKELAVDHDHATNAVRGLLCFNCNQGIGRLQDDPALLRAAAAYLERHAGVAGIRQPSPLPRMVCSWTDEGAPIDGSAWASLMPAGVVG